MAEIVNPIQSPQPPSSSTAAPSTSIPSQPPQIPQVSSPAPQATASAYSQPSPQQPSPAPSQPPATTMPPSLPPPNQQAQAQVQAQSSIPTASSYPARAPPGAPGRNYLNTHLAPYLRNGMNNILDAKPQYPLRWLGEYLIAQSLIHEGGTDEKGMVDVFIYEEHSVQVKKMRPESATALVRAADREGVNGVHADGEEKEGRAVEGEKAGLVDTEMGGA